MYRENVDNCPTIVSRLKSALGAGSEAQTIAEAIHSMRDAEKDEPSDIDPIIPKDRL